MILFFKLYVYYRSQEWGRGMVDWIIKHIVIVKNKRHIAPNFLQSYTWTFLYITYVLIKKPSTPPPKKPIYIFLKIKKNHERSKCVNKISVHGLNRILFIKWCLSNGR